MNPAIVGNEKMKFVGLSTLVRTSSNTRNDMGGVPELWEELKEILPKLSSRIGLERYALISGDLAERVGDSNYYALVTVSSFEGIPEGLMTYELPKGRMAKFFHKGTVENVGDTIRDLLRDWLPGSPESISKNVELFIFAEGYDPMDPDGQFECCLIL